MTTCTLFDPATGEITQVAELSDETFAHYVETGASALLDVRGDPETQYVGKDANDAWALIDYTAEELAAKQSIVAGQKWLMPDRIVVTDDSVPLADLKATKNAEITADRIAADADHFVYSGKAIRTADKDMMDLLVADARIRKGFPANWPGGWKAIDNTYVPISTVEAWDAFFVAMYDAGIANFNHSQSLKASIASATTPEQIASINWQEFAWHAPESSPSALPPAGPGIRFPC